MKKSFVNPSRVALVVAENLSLSIRDKSILKKLSFCIYPEEILAIVGESGSGKSMTALSLMGLLPKNAVLETERLSFDSHDLTSLSAKEKQKQRGNALGMVFQEPQSSLNPSQKCGKQLEEVLKIHRSLERKERRRRVKEALEEVQLHSTDRILESYPHELSGGQKQRIMIAMAYSVSPNC